MSSQPAVELTYGSKDMFFPSSGMQLLSALLQFLGVSILAHCLSRRLASEDLSSLRGWKDLTWPRFCVLVVFLDSWLFLLTCGILIFGIGLDQGITTCSLSIYLCIAFYGTSKLFMYCFLIEKVHVVWAPTSNTKRLTSPVFIICAVTVALYAVVVGLMFIGRVHYMREDGVCVTGVDLFASVPLLSYDLYVNVFLTSMFLWPLVKTGKIDPRLRRIAKRTLVAAIVALTTSTANVLVLTLLHGKELGWVCLGSCGADVLCNALGLFWVTERAVPHSAPHTRIGNTGFLGAPHDPCADGNKSHSMILVNPAESFPSFNEVSAEDKGSLNSPQELKHKGSASIAFASQGMPRRPLVRLHPVSKSSKAPWARESVASCFRKSQEDHQLEVQITTEKEIVEDIVDPRPYSGTSMRDFKSPCPSSDLEQ